MPISIRLGWPESQGKSSTQISDCQHMGMANTETNSKKSPNVGVQPPPLPKPIQHHRRGRREGLFPNKWLQVGASSCPPSCKTAQPPQRKALD